MSHKCRVCGTLLVIGQNWYDCLQKKHIYTCSSCMLEQRHLKGWNRTPNHRRYNKVVMVIKSQTVGRRVCPRCGEIGVLHLFRHFNSNTGHTTFAFEISAYKGHGKTYSHSPTHYLARSKFLDIYAEFGVRNSGIRQNPLTTMPREGVPMSDQTSGATGVKG